ncbi:MAG: hypothetical protein ABSG10_12800 [Terracidiphilus sp.]
MTTLDDLFRYDEEDEFLDDPDTKSILESIDAVIKKRTPQESYDWLCDLENKIMDRSEALASNPEVKG